MAGVGAADYTPVIFPIREESVRQGRLAVRPWGLLLAALNCQDLVGQIWRPGSYRLNSAVFEVCTIPHDLLDYF